MSALGWHHPRKSNEGLQLRLLGVGDHEGVDASTIVASTIVASTIVASIVDAPLDADAPLIIFVGVSLVLVSVTTRLHGSFLDFVLRHHVYSQSGDLGLNSFFSGLEDSHLQLLTVFLGHAELAAPHLV